MEFGVERHALAVIILNYRTADLVVDCLLSVLPQLSEVDGIAVVVDNASGDDSLSAIQDRLRGHPEFARLKVLPAPVNGGFSAGNNLGIRAVSADRYLLANSDTIFRRGAVAQMVRAYHESSAVGLVVPRLEWPDGAPQISGFRFHSAIGEFVRAAATGPVTRVLERFSVAPSKGCELFNPQWVSFACVMIGSRVFDSIGLLDDRYFMYFEDEDFCWRARRYGWRVRFAASARVIHLRGGTSPVKRNERERRRLPDYYYHSRTRFFFKTGGGLYWLAANACWYLGRLVSLARELTGNRQSHLSRMQWLDIWKRRNRK